MFCSSCGTKLEDGAVFCTECGAEQETQIPEQEAPVAEQEPAATAEEIVEELISSAEGEAAEEEAAQKMPMEAPEINFSEDFDPRVFAGLDTVPAPPVFPDMEEETEEIEEPFEEEAAGQPEEKKQRKQKKEKKPKEKKGGKGGLVAAIILIVVLLLAAAAAGFLYYFSMPLTDAELKNDFITNGPLSPAETGGEGFIFEVMSNPPRQTERLNAELKPKDTIWCMVTTQDSEVKRVRTYALSYELTWEGWALVKDGIVEHEKEQWITEPLVGASESVIREALEGQTIQIGEYDYTLTMEDVVGAEITSNPDLKAGTDEVQVEISATSELISWEAAITMNMVFEDGWVVDSLESDPAEWKANPGMEFEPTKDEIKAQLVDMQIETEKAPVVKDEKTEEVETEEETEVETEEETAVETENDADAPAEVASQTVTIKAEDIANLKVEEPEFNLEDGVYTVSCQFDLRKSAAVIEVKAVLTYAFDETWQVQSKEYSSTVKELSLDGVWNGTYQVDGNGLMLKPSVKLTVTTDEKGASNGVFEFGPTNEFPIIPGSYHVLGTIDPKTMTVKFEAGEWITNPNTGIKTVSLEGVLDLETGVLTDEAGTFSMTLTPPERPVEEEEEEADKPEDAAQAANAADAAADATEPAEQTNAPAENTTEDGVPMKEDGTVDFDALNDPALLGPNDLPIG